MSKSTFPKREKVKSFLDDVYDLLIKNDEKNISNVLITVKKHKLTSEYVTALKLSKIIEKRNGIVQWIYKNKPTLKLVDAIIDITERLTLSRNDKYRDKKITNVYKFMRTVYRKTKGHPVTFEKMKIDQIIDKFNLDVDHKEALLKKKHLISNNIITINGEETGYVWSGDAPNMENAAKLYNYVLNYKQANKKKTLEPKDQNMKYIKNY
jgi:hypothetical protein